MMRGGTGGSLLARLTTLISGGVTAGVVVAGIAFPFAASGGLVAKAGSDSFQNLPSNLTIRTPQQNSYLYADDGKTLITEFYDENRQPVSINQVSTAMQQAVVAAEDTRFYKHHGVDMRGVARALLANRQSGTVSQGASTLTMQYVRNVLKDDPTLTPQQRMEATSDTTDRKVREMRYAIALERKYSKAQILERYLNTVYFGHGAYGVEAAAETYFSEPAAQLTLPQATLLAGIIKSPDSYDPTSADPKSALQRRGYVLDAMAKEGYLARSAVNPTAALPLAIKAGQPPNGCVSVPASHQDWGFFCDYFVRWWDSQAEFGGSSQERENKLKEGGYKIVTSLDRGVQQQAENASTGVYGKDNARALPMAAVQPRTGHVLALSVNRNYSLAPNPNGNQFPNTVDPLVTGGGGITGYQTGSTFKMFTMLAALSLGRPLNTGFTAPSPLRTDFPVDPGPASCGGYYCPINDNPSWMDGYRTMWTGYGRSVNTYFVWLEQQIGVRNAVAMAERLGIQFRAQSDAALANSPGADSWGAFTLGVTDTTPLDLANAYATVAAEGTYCQPLPVNSIVDPDGRSPKAASPSCRKVIGTDVARAATDAARCPVGDQSFFGKCDGGTAPDVKGIVGRPVAGKTGSSQNNATESFVGFTPQAAVAGTAANPDDPTDAVGASIAPSVDRAVASTLAAAVYGLPVKNFVAPSSGIAYGSQ